MLSATQGTDCKARGLGDEQPELRGHLGIQQGPLRASPSTWASMPWTLATLQGRQPEPPGTLPGVQAGDSLPGTSRLTGL